MIQLPNGDWINPDSLAALRVAGCELYLSFNSNKQWVIECTTHEEAVTLRDKIALSKSKSCQYREQNWCSVSKRYETTDWQYGTFMTWSQEELGDNGICTVAVVMSIDGNCMFIRLENIRFKV